MTQKKKSQTVINNQYASQYKDPRWQKKRLEILEKDNFTCVRCGDNKSELHVHHTHYTKGSKVWEYNDRELITVCNECHLYIHKIMDALTSFLIPEITVNYRYFEHRYDGCATLDDLNDIALIMYTQGLAGYEGKIISAVIESYNLRIEDEKDRGTE